MAETVTMPKLGFDMAEGTLVRWVIQESEPIAKGQVLAEIETDKATVEVESNFDGVLAKHLVKAGDVVPVNTPIAIVTAPGESLEAGPTPAPAAAPVKTAVSEPVAASASRVEANQAAASDLPGGVMASPVARRMARDFKINLAAVKGSGPGGRIIR
jgi:pyruvate dehydrogenase E2 component (dihydrolipoamide acetyltransferase)